MFTWQKSHELLCEQQEHHYKTWGQVLGKGGEEKSAKFNSSVLFVISA